MPAAKNSTQASAVCPYHTEMAKKGTAQIRNRVNRLGTVITMAAVTAPYAVLGRKVMTCFRARAYTAIVARGAVRLVISVSVFPLVSGTR